MTDLTKPFIGYPGGPQPRKAPRKLYQDTWLDNFIKGFFGAEATGSVLDERTRDKNVTANEIGRAVSLIPDSGDVAKMALLPLAGAIRLGGAKDLIATHAMGSVGRRNIPQAGFLDAPSIGITARRGNDYSSDGPALVFAAGKTDPARLPLSTLVNRDGYFSNPTGRRTDWGTQRNVWDEERFAENFGRELENNRATWGEAWPDLRLGQMWPGNSQGLAIAASPSFKSYKDFETSPFGAGALRRGGKPEENLKYWQELGDDLAHQAKWANKDPDAYTRNLARRIMAGEVPPEHIARLWERAQMSPSQMAELKVHGKLDVSPLDTAVYVPKISPGNLADLEGFRDAGYKIFNPFHLGAQRGRSMGKGLEKLLPRVADPQGGFRLPPNLRLPEITDHMRSAGEPELWKAQLWNSFLEPKAGGSPPLSVAKAHDPFSQIPPALKADEKGLPSQFTPEELEMIKSAKAGMSLKEVFSTPTPKFADLPGGIPLSPPKIAPPPKQVPVSKDTLELILEKPDKELAMKQLQAFYENGYLTLDQYGDAYGAILDKYIMGDSLEKIMDKYIMGVPLEKLMEKYAK